MPCDGLACDDLTIHKTPAVLTKLLLLSRVCVLCVYQRFKARPEDQWRTLVSSCVRCRSRKRQRGFARLLDRQETEPQHILFGTRWLFGHERVLETKMKKLPLPSTTILLDLESPGSFCFFIGSDTGDRECKNATHSIKVFAIFWHRCFWQRSSNSL